MSEVFEGIITKGSRQTVHEVVAPGGLEIADLPGQVVVAYRAAPRQATSPNVQFDDLAKMLSKAFSKVLVVRYDSRIGHRSSCLFRDGRLTRTFGKSDELFVPLDERGEPMWHAPQLRVNDLMADQEYETAKNAIELGLEELNGATWEDLKGLIAKI
jgi:hypothetical protein